MPLDTNAAFQEEARKRSNQPIFLYTVYNYKGTSEDLNFAAYDQNVTFDETEYQKFPITHNEITENVKGEIDSINVYLANVSRLIEAYLQQYDLRGKKVSIKQVWANRLDDPDCFVEFSNYIDSYSSNVKDAIFVLLSKFNVLNVTLPGMVWLRDICQWVFKGVECAYSGVETECNKTWEDCKARSNSRRFIGCRGIPGRRGYV